MLRYHRASQLALRLVSLVRKRSGWLTAGRRYTRAPEVDVEPRVDADFARLAARKLSQRTSALSPSSAEELLEGRYQFLNVDRCLPDPIDWRLACWPEAPHLWRFHLHYHEFLLDLAAEGRRSGEPKWLRRAWDVVTQWIESNPLGDRGALTDAWHPFCISRRLPAWMTLWSVSPPADCRREPVLASMFCQARYLEDHLERDLGGNHLLENARALALVGCFVQGPDAVRWRRKGAKILETELTEQVLPHGEHFERSPGYHAEMLEAMLDVRDAAQALMPELAGLCATTAEQMAGFLAEVLHPDGDLPLLGDTGLAGPEVVGQRIASASASQQLRGPGVLPVPHCDQDCGSSSRAAPARQLGDYWVYRDDDNFLLFDAGPVGPDHLPAHAHADLLSFEASLGGRRLFVDSGVFSYEDDALRQHCRSSAAHNVLQLDGADQCDLWSRFRMGYRGWPFGFRSGQSHGFHWARACHNAYRRLGTPTVGRWIGCRPGGPWLCVDWAEGRGRHDLALWLHLHPDVAVEQVADDELQLDVASMRCRLRYLAPGELTITEGCYCAGFGLRRPAPVVRWTASAGLPAVCGWSLQWGDGHGEASLDCSDAGDVSLCWSEGGTTKVVI